MIQLWAKMWLLRIGLLRSQLRTFARLLISKGVLPLKGARLSQLMQFRFMVAEGGLVLHTALMHVLIGRWIVDFGEMVVLSGAGTLSSDATRSPLIGWAWQSPISCFIDFLYSKLKLRGCSAPTETRRKVLVPIKSSLKLRWKPLVWFQMSLYWILLLPKFLMLVLQVVLQVLQPIFLIRELLWPHTPAVVRILVAEDVLFAKLGKFDISTDGTDDFPLRRVIP